MKKNINYYDRVYLSYPPPTKAQTVHAPHTLYQKSPDLESEFKKTIIRKKVLFSFQRPCGVCFARMTKAGWSGGWKFLFIFLFLISLVYDCFANSCQFSPSPTPQKNGIHKFHFIYKGLNNFHCFPHYSIYTNYHCFYTFPDFSFMFDIILITQHWKDINYQLFPYYF